MSEPFKTEIKFWEGVGEFLDDLQDQLNVMEWTFSPSRAYLLLAWMMQWCKDHGVPLAANASLLYVKERIEARAAELQGTSDDELRVMIMDKWRDAKPSDALSVFKSYSWFVPTLLHVITAAANGYQNTAVTDSGQKLTPGEAVNTIFVGVDRCYKDYHFQQKNYYGAYKPVPWLDFVRDEMMVWRDELADKTVIPPPSGSTAFSVGGM